jgi:hypothetical protein
MQPGEVAAVRAQDQVEAAEILRRHGAGAQAGKVDTVAGGDGDRAGIGWPASVPVAGAGRVLAVGGGMAGRAQHLSRPAFQQRRAADVSHANKQYFQ